MIYLCARALELRERRIRANENPVRVEPAVVQISLFIPFCSSQRLFSSSS